MNILFISGSSVPTMCGVGKFTHRIINILNREGFNAFLLTNKNQKLFKKDASTEKQYNATFLDIKVPNLFKIIRNIKKTNPEIINIQYNSVEFGRSLFPSLLAVIIKIVFPKIYLQVTIHEFVNYTLLGKIRHIIPCLVANKAFFSDQSQLNSANDFVKGMIKSKSTVLALGAHLSADLNSFIKIDPNSLAKKENINICFHGLVQPSNGLEYLVEAFQKIDSKLNCKLHILGDIKLLIDYGKMNSSVKNYQFNLLQKIDQSKKNIIIYGDIDPQSENFKNVLKEMDLFIFPDVNGITIRRSSFWNVFMQANFPAFVTYVDQISDPILKNLIHIMPKSSEDIFKKLQEYITLNIDEKEEIIDKQQQVRDYMSSENIEKQVINQIVYGK